MMQLRLSDQLDQEIFDQGIILDYTDILTTACDGAYYAADDLIAPVIAIKGSIRGSRNETVAKAHELGHHYSCICDLTAAPDWIQKKYEVLADRWKLQRIMPIDKLIRAFDAGNVTPLSLADELELPVEELMSGITLYQKIYGPKLHHGQYTITWCPFNIKRDRRRRAKY